MGYFKSHDESPRLFIALPNQFISLSLSERFNISVKLTKYLLICIIDRLAKAIIDWRVTINSEGLDLRSKQGPP